MDTLDTLDTGTRALLEAVDAQTASLLESLGLSDGGWESLTRISFSEAADLLLQMFRTGFREILGSLAGILGLLLLLCLVQALCEKSGAIRTVTGTVFAVGVGFAVFVPMTACVSEVISALNMSSDFTKILVPVLASVLTVQGKPSMAFGYSGLCLSASAICSALVTKCLAPACAVSGSLTLVSSFDTGLRTGKAAAFLQKGIRLILSGVAVLFTAVTGLREFAASSADAVSVKSVQFLIGNAVPVVGSALSDSVNTVFAELGLLKSTTGLLGIVILVLMHLPAAVKPAVWLLGCRVLSGIADALGQSGASDFLDGVSGIFGTLVGTVLFQCDLLLTASAAVIVMGN